MLSYFSGSDTIDDRVYTAWKEQVHDTDKDTTSIWETVHPICQESRECESQTDYDDHDVSDAGMQSFSLGFTWAQHSVEYDYVWSGDAEEIYHSDKENS